MDIVPILLQLVLVAFLIFMNGFFVAAEFACVKIRPSRLETLIQGGSKRAAYAKRLTASVAQVIGAMARQAASASAQQGATA